MRSRPIPIACTLDGNAVAGRVEEWRAALAHVTGRHPIDGGVRLTLAPGTPLPEVARLMAAEQDCCRFFSFALTVDDRGAALEVRAPADGMPVLESLFGQSEGPTANRDAARR